MATASPPPAASQPAYRPPARRGAAASPEPAPTPPSETIPQPSGARLAPGTPIPPAELEAFVDGVVRQAMASEHIAGVTVSVVQNGQVVLKKGFGLASLSPARPVDPDKTLFRIGSISKTFTWIAIMRQVEKGRMGLSAPVNQYLPERLQVRDQGYARRITVRDLMNQTTGFEDRTLGKLYERDPSRVRPLETYLRQEAPHRVRAAGALPIYSSYGAGLAGEAVAQVAGQPFQTLMERDIFQPLGLGHTTFREPYPPTADLPPPMSSDLAAHLSDGFGWSDGAVEPRPFEYMTQIAPAASASSTAADMGRYMALILGDGSVDGVTLYGPATAQGFRAVTTRGAPDLAGWANGFVQRRLPGGFDGFGQSGRTLSFNSNMVTVPSLGLGIFVADNTETGGDLAQQLPSLIVGRFYGGTKVISGGDPRLEARRGAFAGLFNSERRSYRGLEEFADLFQGAVTVDVTPDGRLTTRWAGGQRAWIPKPGAADGVFQAVDGPDVSVFEMQGGRAVRWFGPGGGESFKRAGLLSRPGTVILLAGLALIAAAATLIGLFLRDRRDFRQTSIQSRASSLQTATAVLWLLAIAGFVIWGADAAADEAKAASSWPGPWLLLGSACALVAAMLTIGNVVVLPAIWRGGRRLDSWTGWRKLRFTLTSLIFAALAVVLALNGALEPWSS